MGKLPFLAKFLEKRREDSPIPGIYSEGKDVHVKLVNGKKLPLILTEEFIPETKTITEVIHERED